MFITLYHQLLHQLLLASLTVLLIILCLIIVVLRPPHPALILLPALIFLLLGKYTSSHLLTYRHVRCLLHSLLNLTFNASSSIVSGTFTAASPAPSGYVVVRTTGGPFIGAPANGINYTAGSPIGSNGTVAYVGSSTAFTDGGLTAGTGYTYTVFSYTSGVLCSIVYNTANPLTSNVTTGSVNIYTWNKTRSSAFGTASNWTPARTVPDPTDILVFDNGVSDTATGVPTQSVGRISIANSTQAHLRASSGTSAFTVNSNGTVGGSGIDIAAGSALILDGANSFPLTFGAGSVPNIAGTLEVSNTGSGLNSIDFTNTVTVIAATGQLASGGHSYYSAIHVNCFQPYY